jgi:amidophosphoribosyltransferase
VASSHTIEEIGRYITADTIGYLSLEGMQQAVTDTRGFDRSPGEFCHACFSGEYPIEVAAPSKARQLPLLLV